MSQPTLPDLSGKYAATIEAHLTAVQKPLTVAELCEQLKLSDRVVRMGIDRLAYTEKITGAKRHDAHRRGSMPLEYSLVTAGQ